jgi:hypothetical protein
MTAINAPKKPERIFEVTFTNHSSIFIQAMDEAHARRIVEKSGSIWTRGDDSVEMVIEKIKACGQTLQPNKDLQVICG